MTTSQEKKRSAVPWKVRQRRARRRKASLAAAPINIRHNLIQYLPKDSVGAEIGVWRGDFTASMLRILAPKKLWLIDPWVAVKDERHARAWYSEQRTPDMEALYRSTTERFAAQIVSGQVVVMRKKSSEALPELPDNSLDFIYIDGDHEYSAISNDLRLAMMKVKVNGLICGEDYHLRGWFGDGVVRAVHETIATGAVLIDRVEGQQYILRKLR